MCLDVGKDSTYTDITYVYTSYHMHRGIIHQQEIKRKPYEEVEEKDTHDNTKDDPYGVR